MGTLHGGHSHCVGAPSAGHPTLPEWSRWAPQPTRGPGGVPLLQGDQRKPPRGSSPRWSGFRITVEPEEVLSLVLTPEGVPHPCPHPCPKPCPQSHHCPHSSPFPHPCPHPAICPIPAQIPIPFSSLPPFLSPSQFIIPVPIPAQIPVPNPIPVPIPVPYPCPHPCPNPNHPRPIPISAQKLLPKSLPPTPRPQPPGGGTTASPARCDTAALMGLGGGRGSQGLHGHGVEQGQVAGTAHGQCPGRVVPHGRRYRRESGSGPAQSEVLLPGPRQLHMHETLTAPAGPGREMRNGRGDGIMG